MLGLGLTRSSAFQSAAIRGRQLFGGARLRQYPFHQHPPAFTSVRSTKFDRMLRDLAQHLMPFFAGQRVRTAEVIVELAGREPVVVVRTTFAILTFDGERRIVPSELHRQQVALAEVAVAPVLGASRGTETVVDAATDSSREALLDTIRHPWQAPLMTPRWGGESAGACRPSALTASAGVALEALGQGR